MAIDIEETTIYSSTAIAAGTASSAHQHDKMSHYSVWSNFTDGTPAQVNLAIADITTTGDYFKVTNHGLKTGLPGHFTSPAASLPTGLLTATTYYVIELTSDTFSVANSRANALLGTKVTLAKDNNIGGFKPDALGTVDIHLEGSLDGSNYWKVPGTTITSVGSTCTSVANIAYNYVRVNLTVTAGQLVGTVKARSLSSGD